MLLLLLLFGKASINIDIGNRVVDLVPGAVCCEVRLLILTFRKRDRRLSILKFACLRQNEKTRSWQMNISKCQK